LGLRTVPSSTTPTTTAEGGGGGGRKTPPPTYERTLTPGETRATTTVDEEWDEWGEEEEAGRGRRRDVEWKGDVRLSLDACEGAGR